MSFPVGPVDLWAGAEPGNTDAKRFLQVFGPVGCLPGYTGSTLSYTTFHGQLLSQFTLLSSTNLIFVHSLKHSAESDRLTL